MSEQKKKSAVKRIAKIVAIIIAIITIAVVSVLTFDICKKAKSKTDKMGFVNQEEMAVQEVCCTEDNTYNISRQVLGVDIL